MNLNSYFKVIEQMIFSWPLPTWYWLHIL